jgi:RNase P subunit RPR2
MKYFIYDGFVTRSDTLDRLLTCQNCHGMLEPTGTIEVTHDSREGNQYKCGSCGKRVTLVREE